MDASVPVLQAAQALPAAAEKMDGLVVVGATKSPRSQLFLKFTLGQEMFAIDIQHIREIIEYTPPNTVPMTPPALLGVINVRGSVVPVVDLALRFGWESTTIGRRSSIVIVEITHQEQKHVLGLLVDRVNAVAEIASNAVEPVPAFGASIHTDFIAGIAKVDGRFVIILSIGRTLSVAEIAAGIQSPETGI